jgi:siroheme synthase-like protein
MQKETMPDKNQLYPVFLKLHELRLLLVGGGNVALEKLQSVLANSPDTRITIVAPMIREEVRNLIATFPQCILVERPFEERDIDNADVIICATDNKELHKQIKGLANKKKILVNVADTPELCDFYLGSIVQKGNLKIGVSTNGKSPTVAKRIKELLNDVLPEEVDELLDNMQAIRNKMKVSFDEKVKRLNEITKELSAKDNNNELYE